MEGLTRLIKEAQLDGRLDRVKISIVTRITHILFVHDVLLFGKVSIEEWSIYKEVLDLFCSATSMDFSHNKSMFLEVGLDGEVLSQIKLLLPFNIQPLESGFKYLVFFLKPNDYHKED